MKTGFLQIITLAAAASAAPSAIQRRQTASCNAGSLSQLCCIPVLAGISLNCVLQVIGDTCTTEAYCCDVDDNSQVCSEKG